MEHANYHPPAGNYNRASGAAAAPISAAPPPTRRTEALDNELTGIVQRAIKVRDRLQAIADTQLGGQPRGIGVNAKSEPHTALLDRLDDHTGDLNSILAGIEDEVERLERL